MNQMRRTRNRNQLDWKYNIDSDYCRSSEEENKITFLLKWPHYPKIYKFSTVPWHIFHRTGINNPKMYMEPQNPIFRIYQSNAKEKEQNGRHYPFRLWTILQSYSNQNIKRMQRGRLKGPTGQIWDNLDIKINSNGM